MDYNIELGVDGFWELRENGERVFMRHDDHVPDELENYDERLLFMIECYYIHMEEFG